ncbi:MAG: flagellar protein FlaG [Lachnospiraceae bacterium]|nr:flagellar protein FlaG [Lachnospiraceae bacterium]
MEPIGSIMTLNAQPIQRQMTPVPTTEKSNPVTVDPSAFIDSTTITVAKPENNSQNNDKAGQGQNGNTKDQEMISADQIKKAVDTLNKNMAHSEAVFGVHEKTNRVTIKIVDKDTKELIKELPPEKTLDMIAKAWELAGLLVDERR